MYAVYVVNPWLRMLDACRRSRRWHININTELSTIDRELEDKARLQYSLQSQY